MKPMFTIAGALFCLAGPVQAVELEPPIPQTVENSCLEVPHVKGRDLSKAQCKRVVRDYKAFVIATIRKHPGANFGPGMGGSCVLYCYDLYPDTRIPIP